MAGLDKETPILTSHHIKELYPDICQLMLVNNNANLSYLLRSEKEISESIERVFVWNGSTKVFLAMAKYLEDKINLEADTKLGDVRVILVVEDSVKYYSRYLPLLHQDHEPDTGHHRRGILQRRNGCNPPNAGAPETDPCQ